MAPLSVRAVDGVCIVFAAWTLCCHAVTALEGSLWWLLGVFAAVSIGLLALWLVRRGGAAPAPPAFPPAAAGSAPVARLPRILQVAGLALGVGGALLLRENALGLWWWTVLLLGGALVVFVLPEEPRAEPPASGRGLEVGLWGLAVACAVLALVSHRVDFDDAFYVNLAVAAADAPGAPLLAGDTLHGIAGLPMHLPVYRLHSYEIWNGALSLLTGVPAVACFHLISAALGALLVPLCLARLLRWLTPRGWLWTVLAVVWVLVAAGDAHRWYGNFAFVRIWQGKSIFLFVFLPLVYAYALEFALRPAWRSWVLLAAAQIAALGCSSSAVWAAPAGALVAACCALRPTRAGLRRLLLVALASIYVLGMGWGMKQMMELDREVRARPSTEEMEPLRAQKAAERVRLNEPGNQLERALELVTGRSHLRTATLVALLAAWACCGRGLARRFAIVVPLAVMFVILNPYTTTWLSENVTGPSYWRGLWALPVPLLMALVLVAPLQVAGRRRWLGVFAVLAGFAAFAAAVPGVRGLSLDNEVELGWPRLKVPPESYRWAMLLTQKAGPGAAVVAPGPISMWLPMLHERVHPLVVRPMYLYRYENQLGMEEFLHRLLMANYAGGEAKRSDAQRWFARGLERFDVRAVCLKNFPGAPRARVILRAAGFELDLKSLEYEIWLRS
ncbi:MAG: hypothetical protein JRS35_12315 [Deltaproteobacteria bacterium]|nr:hypothetical protein [Deltaproteobacteria bacterium]